MRPLLPLLLLLAAAPVAAAQAPDSTATDSLPPGALSGTVADSLGGRPGALEGAEVWLDRSARTARTDRRGRFRIQGLPPGRYRVTFSHPRLDSVGVGAPVREVDVPPGGEATVALATPGTPTVIANLCGAIPDTSFGLVVGTVRDAVTGSPLPGVRVAARWRVTTIGTDGIRTEEEGAVSATGPDGLFVLCGVPADVAVLVRADSGAHATGLMEVYMAGRRVQGLDLAMARDDSVVADSGVAGASR